MNFHQKIIVGIFALFFFKANAQVDQGKSLDTLAGNVIKKLRSDDREKIFIHTNKWYFIAGEELWFRAYCINALSHKIFHRSKIMFVDLVNDNDSVIAQLYLNDQQLKLEGKIVLSSGLEEGYYWLRAYTPGMLKYDQEKICVQPIYILNSRKPAAKINYRKQDTSSFNSSPDDMPQINFYAEGGALISGTNSVVAFSATDKNKNPLFISGYVTDSWDSVVARFTTKMPGLGDFKFYVWRSRKYIAHIKWNDKDFTYSFPLVNQYSSRLSVITQTDNYVQLLVSQGDSVYRKHKLSYVLGLNRDSLCFAAVGIDMYDFTISKDKFPAGKTTFLLFDENKQLISERDIFISDLKKIIITADRKEYNAREKVKLEIFTGDSSRPQAIALLSLAVTDDNIAGTNNFMEDQISEIKNDNIDFLQQRDSISKNYTPEQWDLIMLTQKNNYEDEFIKNENHTIPDTLNTDDLVLNRSRGKIVTTKNEPAKNTIVTILSKEAKIIKTDTTDEGGKFHFELPEDLDSTQFILQAIDPKGKILNHKIILDPFRSPVFKTSEKLKQRFLPAQVETLTHFKTHQLDTVIIETGKGWLKAVTIKGIRKKELPYDESKRITNFSRIITGEQLENNSGPNGIVNAILMTIGMHLSDFGINPKSSPLLLVDGVPVDLDNGPQIFDTKKQSAQQQSESPLIQYLNRFSPSLIDFIEVIKGSESAIYGIRGANGVISINTTSKLRVQGNFNGLMKYTFTGFFHPPAFNAPNYDLKELKRSADADRRSTIYWNANLFTDKKGYVPVNFFTADAKTNYTVIITGINSTGEILYKKYKIIRQ
jgi:hypothetical protein